MDRGHGWDKGLEVWVMGLGNMATFLVDTIYFSCQKGLFTIFALRFFPRISTNISVPVLL